ncbi:hypothetical protein cypCar_00035370 [Cyprinus carpio]|nr:hypothetical protein cypCar_00035370 [Cyprinus carpio]
MVESKWPGGKQWRWTYHHLLKDSNSEYYSSPVITSEMKSPPPHNIAMFVGSAYFTLSREFVFFVNQSSLASDFLAWSEDTFSPDEHFWATMIRVSGVPGEVPSSDPEISELASKTRLVKWWSLEERFYPPCTGVRVREVCIYGSAELRWLLNYGHWFANKVDPKVDPVLMECLEEKLAEKRLQREIRISPANVGFVPLYGANLKHKVLALFAPEDQFTAVALFLADQWYAVEDILRTSNTAREGLVKVRSVGERIVLYVLNRIIYRTAEMGSNEVPFLCHGEEVFAKILWKNGEAVGFYSVKSKGSLCNSFVSQCYLLPVMDSIFVRKDHRGNGHGLQMLEDFVDSFKDDELGLKYPLTPAMQKVCRQYLRTYPADVDLLWEVEGVGGPYQKVKVASKLGSMTLQCNHSSWAAEESKNGEVVVNEVEMTEESSLDITEDVVVVNKHLKVAEEISALPISTRTRSSERRQKKRPREEPEESAVENRPEKINRSLKTPHI